MLNSIDFFSQQSGVLLLALGHPRKQTGFCGQKKISAAYTNWHAS